LLQFNTSNGELVDPLAVSAVLTSKETPSNFAATVNTANTLTLNGVTLTPPASMTPARAAFTSSSSAQDLVDWLNAFTQIDGNPAGSTGVKATLVNGKLELTLADKSTSQEIRLGMGTAGTPAALATLGFDTTFYAKGVTRDDLMIFVTDRSGAAQIPAANLTAQIAGMPSDMKQSLRAQSLEIRFTSDSQYTIRDAQSNTLLATRIFDRTVTPIIEYRGLKLEFSNLPVKDDVFRVDGNQDGIGNNENMLKLIGLEDQKVMPGNLTLTEYYIERVNQVGNVARQAAISKDALNVVFRQAKEARDSTSGVSLDEEASALVRFQQAYQANAKVMQMGSQLFEAILNVR
jgi:flagellar hook-associated protein 1 FlgK